MVPVLPPAPALRVEAGRAFFTDSLWSAAARRRIAARGPPGGELARATADEEEAGLRAEESGPESGPEVMGEDGRGEAYSLRDQHACKQDQVFDQASECGDRRLGAADGKIVHMKLR